MQSKTMFLFVFLGLSSLCSNTFASQTFQQFHHTWELQAVYSPNSDHKSNFEEYKTLYVTPFTNIKKAFTFGDLNHKSISNISEITDHDRFKSQFMLDEVFCIKSNRTAAELQELLKIGSMIVATKTEPDCYGTLTTVLPAIVADPSEIVITPTPQELPQKKLPKPTPQPEEITLEENKPKLEQSKTNFHFQSIPNSVRRLTCMAIIIGIGIWKFDTISEYFSDFVSKLFPNYLTQK